jgi:hypothetical protein
MFTELILDPIAEIHALMPDSIMFGSLLLYFLTQNIAFGVFAVFIFQNVLSHRLISWIFAQSVGSSQPGTVGCRSGFKIARLDINRIFDHDPYPSYGIFSITSIATYLGLATKEFTPTLDAMGSVDWSSRSIAAYVCIGIVLALFVIVRLLVCTDTFGEMMIAMGLAIIVGIIFFFVNKKLFGLEALNFLGLPYLVSKEEKGAPIYVCAAEK